MNLALLLAFLSLGPILQAAERKSNDHWFQLAPLPEENGLAGCFAGTSHGSLVVAGGANFPDKKPWMGGSKVWHDRIFVLDRPGGDWKTAGRLAHPLAYGVSARFGNSVICAGGSSSLGHHATVTALTWQNGRIESAPLPPLPGPLANSCGANVGTSLFVAGGTTSPDATAAVGTLLKLDLAHPQRGWTSLPPLPGSPRMLAVSGVLDGWFYVMGGVSLAAGNDGKPVRTYLKNMYRFKESIGWERLADLPAPIAAAASPAPRTTGGDLLLFGGDDGTRTGISPELHPGFPPSAWIFLHREQTWRTGVPPSVARATLPAVVWRGLALFISGETRPGIRSPEVWAFGNASSIEQGHAPPARYSQ